MHRDPPRTRSVPPCTLLLCCVFACTSSSPVAPDAALSGSDGGGTLPRDAAASDTEPTSDAGRRDAGAAMDARAVDVGPHHVDASTDGASAAPLLLMGRCVMPAGEPCMGFETDALFAPFDDAIPVPIILGPQGFYMVILSARIRDIPPGDPSDPSTSPTLDILLTNDAGETRAHFSRRGSFDPDPELGGWFHRTPIQVVLDGVPPDMEDIDLAATLTRVSGRSDTTSGHFTAQQ